MYQLRSVDVMACAKILGVLHACLGLVFVPLFFVVGLAGTIFGQKEGSLPGILLIFFSIFIPVFYGVMGFIMGALGSWLYNAIAKRIGGIQMDLAPMGGSRAPAVS